MDSVQTQFLELLDGVLDDSCADGQRERLADLIRRHPQLVDEVINQLRIHSLLQWQCDELRINIQAFSDGVQSPKSTLGFSRRVQFLARGWLWAAAILILVGVASVLRQAHRSNQDRSAVAEIVDQQLAVWSDETTGLLDEKHVKLGLLSMKSGAVTLRFRSGATVTATGDLSMRVESDMLLLLDRGQATAEVPPAAIGFTIKTPRAEVVDLGTKFGVVARSGGSTDVLVFEGQVDLKPTLDTADPQKRLTQGEGARISNEGSIDRIVEIRRDIGGASWTTDLRIPGESVFKSIHDNLHSSDSAKYYQITPRGLLDDSLAYVDRPHEWNGMTTDGLPEFLQHADYIRTFNETRYFSKLEIVVELARPALVYIFFDDRVTPPDWLMEQFEKTDVEIGLDEGPWQPGDLKHTVAVGGGQSIDTVFHVWRRHCAKGEILTFGPLGQKLADCAMYGIAAQPGD